MAVLKRSLRESFRARAPKGKERQDNRLSYMDQASFLTLRATGRGQLVQLVWIYEHPVDFDGLRRFHHNMCFGLAGRQIERSPLPFGRHRWVSSGTPPSEIDFVECARPRAELSDWVDERSQVPVDPEWGPGWHIGVLPMTDGSTAISLIGSHCLADGVGGLLLIFDAITGNLHDFGYPPPRSRTRLRAITSDLRGTMQDAPEVARTLVAGAKLAFRRRYELVRSKAPQPTAILAENGDENVVMPVISVYIDLADWDARAEALGGTSYSLLAGFAAKLGERMERCRAADGAVTLLIALSDRTLEDTQAHAMSFVNVSVDPTYVATDLTGARGVIRQALTKLRRAPDESFELLPLNPFVPKRAVKRTADRVFGFADPLVACSNLGEIPPDVGRLDGTVAEYVMLRGVDQGVKRADIERAGGQLVLVAGRLGGKMSIGITAYQAGEHNSKARLRELVAKTLAEFELTAVID
ncbi:MAG: hypothetical protein JWR37_5851 [Mycobacterium sp.]|nr:hypothetical protein [Mycobacterium sp.]